MRNFLTVIATLVSLMCWMPSSLQAQGADVALRFSNVSLDCTNDSLFVDIQVSNPTGADYIVSSMSLRFTFNSAMLGSPVIKSTVAPGSHSLSVQSGIWSYGVVDFAFTRNVPTGGAWQTVGTMGFPVNNFDAAGNPNCINLNWQTTLPAITTIQQYISFTNQPAMNIISYGNNNTCIIDSCQAAIPDSLTLDFFATNVTCAGVNDGTIDLTVNGGTPPFTYLWSNGATTEDVSGLAAGSYGVTVTDDAGATATANGIAVAANSLTVQVSVTNALCNASDDGTIAASAIGGTGPYTYLWSTGETTPTIIELPAGSYDVTATDANGCTGIVKGMVVTEPGEFIYNVNLQNVSCAGGNDGSLDFSLTGGTPPYNYIWIEYDQNTFMPIDTFATTEDVSGLATGLFSVEITDANGCTGAVFYIIQEPTPILVDGNAATVLTNVECFGESNGAIDISASGGFGVLSFEWSNGSLSEDIQNLSAGIYSVTVTDLNGCTVADTFEITQPDSIFVTLNVNGTQNVSCFGGADGAIDITAGGGNGTLSYFWSNGEITQDISGLTAGTYSLTVTDSLGCSNNLFDIEITQPDSLVLSAVLTNTSCFQTATGAIDLTVVGGTAPYSYAWTGGGATQDTAGLLAGNYTVTVTDSLGCVATGTYTITDAPDLVVSLESVTEVSCGGADDGAIDISVTGGTVPYTYLWVPGGATSQDTAGLAGGVYQVFVTDANGCLDSLTVTVGEAPVLTITNGVATDASCNGFADGSIDITVGGGTPPYTYAWTGGGATQDTAGLLSGTYGVTVSDSRGCSTTGSFTVGEPNLLVATIDSQTNVSCNGGVDGAIDISVSGGTAPYTYAWSPGGATSQDTAGLVAGTYTVVVTDANGCTATTSATISESGTLTITPVATTNVSCNGFADGAIDVTVSGGTAPYTYAWTPGGGASEDTSGLLAGTYTLSVTDANGCFTSAPFTVTQPSTLVASITSTTNASCFGAADGAFDLTVIGGTTPYTYAWSPGGGAAQDTSGLLAGSYVVTVTDANGCTTTAFGSITEPDTLTITVAGVTDVSCNGFADGAIDVTIAGGTGPFTYAWAPGGGATADTSGLLAGAYTLSVTDANGCTATGTVTVTEPDALVLTLDSTTNVSCNGVADGALFTSVTGGTAPYTYAWTGGGATQDTTGLLAGNYGVTVTDANGCSASGIFSVTEPDALSASIAASDNASCFGSADGAINVTVTGGTQPYTYLWSPGGGMSEDTFDLAAGVYTVTITDLNGCTTTATDTITEPTPLFIDLNGQSNVTCFGGADGAIDVAVGGGTAPYTYAWSPGAGASEDTSGLLAGTYTLILTDANGCADTADFTITQPDSLTLTLVTVTDVTCNGANDGSIDLEVTGGTAPYTYVWTAGNGMTQDTSGLAEGTYTVVVTDANGCTATTNATINEDSPLTVSLDASSNVSCFGDADGSLDISVNGGVAPYTYTWTPGGGATQDTSGLAAGTYIVSVSDASGCSATDTFTITEPTELSLSYTATDVACAGGNDGAIDLTITGGTAPYTYAWGAAGNTEDLTGLVEGIYSVTVTDANGCTVARTIGINTITTLVLNTAATNVLCGESNGEASVSVSGGSGLYTYLWSNGETTATIDSLPSGTYNVTVQEAGGGCSATASVVVNSTNGLTINPTVTDIICGGAGFGVINLTVTGGSGNYTYLWSENSTTSAISNLRAGTYSVTVTDTTTGCVGSLSIDVEESSPLVLNATSTDETCGQADGSVSISVTGGTSPYTYLWSTGDVTASVTGLTPGFFQVTATDANGCTASAVVALGTVGGPSVTSFTVTDLTCANQTTGAIDITVTGGQSPYTYIWSNGATTEDIAGLLSGPYIVTVTDANGCATSDGFVVGTPDEIVIVADRTNVTCNNANDGAINVSVSGGVSPYTYAWSNGSSAPSLSGLSGGSYTVTVTDANNCSAATTIVINEPNTLTLSATATDVLCAGGADGTIDLTVSGGTLPYTYYWSNGAVTEDLTGLPEGLYSVLVTDASGCTAQLTKGVNTINTLVLNIATTNSGCNETVGVASISASGGSAPYTYLWSNGDTTAIIDSLAAGPYSVTVTDANGCTAEESQTIVGPAPISVSIVSTPSQCGENNGTAEVIIGGVLVNPAILWSNGDTTAAINNLAPGAYTVTVTDPDGCSEEITTSVGNSSNVEIVVTATDAACGQNDGSVASTVVGGNGVYTYLWSNGATTGSITGVAAGTYTLTVTDSAGCINTAIASVGNVNGPSITIDAVVNPSCATTTGSISITATGTGLTYLWSNGATTDDITNLGTGPYSVTVTDANGCSATASASITIPSSISASLGYAHVSCNGAADAAIDLTVTGGTAPYTYAWSNAAATQDLSGLDGGTYTVTITDANGCTATTFVDIIEPNQLDLTATATDVVCNGGADGAIDLTVSGGTAPYTVVWSNGAATEDLTALSAGLYVVYVTDANGCTEQLAVTVGTANTLTINTAVTNATCGESNGSAAVFVSGGSGSYTYLWGTNDVTSSIANLAAGVYPVTVTDGNGCTASENVVVSATSDLDVVVSSTNAACGAPTSGAIDLTVTGGTAPYTYTWTGTAQTGANITGLAAGTYNATVTDAAGCSTGVTVDITEESTVSATANLTNPFCGQGTNAGAIDVVATGGSAPYTVTWSNGATGTSLTGLSAGTYTYTVVDANGCDYSEVLTLSEGPLAQYGIAVTNLGCAQSADGAIDVTPVGSGAFTYTWSNGATTQNLTGLVAGTYTVTITDNDFCVTILSATVAGADALHVVADRTDVDCNGSQNGGVDVTVTGGSAPYTYAWSGGLAAQQNQTGLGAGSYTVSVTDAKGCFAATTIDISEPDSLVASIVSIDSVSCNGLADGAIDIDVTGGTAPYTYLWSAGGATSQDTSGLATGTYTVIVTDASGCTATLSATVGQPDSLSLAVNASSDVSCNGAADGTASVAAAGGTAPYTYTWSDAAITGANATGLSGGSYWVFATDVNGCATDTSFITIGEPDTISAQIGVTDVACNGFNNGEIRIKIVTGGTAPYTFDWGAQGTNNVISDLSAGTYTVTITDDNGCTRIYSIDIDEANALDITGSGATNVSCPDSADGSIDMVVTGGTMPYFYAWSTGDTTEDLTGLAVGTYTVTVFDANECFVTDTFNISAGTCNNPPVAVTDTAQTFERTPVDISVINNDYDPDSNNIFVTGIVRSPNNGTATLNSDQTITYTPEDGFVGVDSFTYVLCDDGIPSLCDTGLVIVIVLPNRPNIDVPNAFSPNGDGVNDMFVIEDITEFPENKLIIFNRWGSEVYIAAPYQNDWNGSNKDGQPLPDGTYFYVLEINDAEGTPPYTGYVVIHRGSLGN